MFYTDEQKNEARNTDMMQFLAAIEGFDFKRCGKEYHCIQHDSLVIKSDCLTWYWNSRCICGRNAIDWCVKVRGMSFCAAMQLIAGKPEGISSPKRKTYAKTPVSRCEAGALNYVKIPNVLLDMGLSDTELSIIVYLSSICPASRWIQVKQTTIAEKCSIKSVQTVGRAISSLLEKRLIERSARILKQDNHSGTTCYNLSLPDLSDGYFVIERKAINGSLSPRQMKAYLHICRCVDVRIGFCWNSYNDLARRMGVKRADAIKLIRELTDKKYIRKQLVRCKSSRSYADNRYAVIFFVNPRLSCRNKKIEAALSNRHWSNCPTNNMFYTICNYTLSCDICQVVNQNFFGRGSPRNVMSYILTKTGL